MSENRGQNLLRSVRANFLPIYQSYLLLFQMINDDTEQLFAKAAQRGDTRHLARRTKEVRVISPEDAEEDADAPDNLPDDLSCSHLLQKRTKSALDVFRFVCTKTRFLINEYIQEHLFPKDQTQKPHNVFKTPMGIILQMMPGAVDIEIKKKYFLKELYARTPKSSARF